MSGAAGAAAAAAAAAAAEAEAKRRREEEEETLTGYRQDDLQQEWEFKILRAINNGFRDPARLHDALQQEAAAGWVLLEKLDDNRLRLKRRADAGRDRGGSDLAHGGVDPYRTWYETTPEAHSRHVAFVILGATLAIAAVAILLVLLLR